MALLRRQSEIPEHSHNIGNELSLVPDIFEERDLICNPNPCGSNSRARCRAIAPAGAYSCCVYSTGSYSCSASCPTGFRDCSQLGTSPEWRGSCCALGVDTPVGSSTSTTSQPSWTSEAAPSVAPSDPRPLTAEPTPVVNSPVQSNPWTAPVNAAVSTDIGGSGSWASSPSHTAVGGVTSPAVSIQTVVSIVHDGGSIITITTEFTGTLGAAASPTSSSLSPTATETTSSSSTDSGMPTAVQAGLGAGISIAVLAAILAFFCIRHRKKKQRALRDEVDHDAGRPLTEVGSHVGQTSPAYSVARLAGGGENPVEVHELGTGKDGVIAGGSFSSQRSQDEKAAMMAHATARAQRLASARNSAMIPVTPPGTATFASSNSQTFKQQHRVSSAGSGALREVSSRSPVSSFSETPGVETAQLRGSIYFDSMQIAEMPDSSIHEADSGEPKEKTEDSETQVEKKVATPQVPYVRRKNATSGPLEVPKELQRQ